jgi:hypothetical protein
MGEKGQEAEDSCKSAYQGDVSEDGGEALDLREDVLRRVDGGVREAMRPGHRDLPIPGMEEISETFFLRHHMDWIQTSWEEVRNAQISVTSR